MLFIEDTKSLSELCKKLETEKFITVDTEFVREKTYYPKLCLIQVGFSSDAAIIDPMAKGIVLDSFFDLMCNQNVLKVFHAGKQDIEIFYHLSKKIPTPVFDTQIAASVCGFGKSISYDALVYHVTKVELDKSSRLTDWTLRPLEKKQLEYALRDVTFLILCYEYLAQQLKKLNRTHWIDEEICALTDENAYLIDPDMAWKRIKHSAHSTQFLIALRALASWREKRAMKYDVPKRNILKDDLLLSIASTNPKNIADLKRVRNIRPDVAEGKLGAEIIETLNTARSTPQPKNLKKMDEEGKCRFSGNMLALAEVLKLLLKIKSEQEGVVPSIIADDEDILDFVCEKKNSKLLSGWRYEIFGREALAFRKGNASLFYNPEKKQIIVDIQKEDD